MTRKPDHDIEPLFAKRWSPRSFTGEATSKESLDRLFEAARWAPSSFNSQPWRFLYSVKGDSQWDGFFDLLVDFNKMWAKNAGALIIVLSRKTFSRDGEFSPTHQFDTGAAWQNMALQATQMGLHAHGIGGFDATRARTVFGVPDEFDVIAMVAVGKKDDPSRLDEEMQKDERPSDRLPISELSRNGPFDEALWK